MAENGQIFSIWDRYSKMSQKRQILMEKILREFIFDLSFKCSEMCV